MKPQPDQASHPATPATCPFCGASKIKATSEKADASSYWRCVECGEMWNPNRMQPAPFRRNSWGPR